MNLSRFFDPGWRRGMKARQKLTESYRSVFFGNATREQASIVLSDLANYSGFYKIVGLDGSPDMRAFCDGQRSVFARIFRFLRMTEAEILQLEEGARSEGVTSQIEGDIL